MTTLTRYLLRAHVGPFLFACSALTALLFLTAITQRFQELAGKGVGARVILELMFLSLPHVVTLAVPMALFAASLYVCAELAQGRELLALAAGGVHPRRLIGPIAALGLAMSLLMVPFNDRVLASANARFQDRIEDVARKSPALRLRPGVMNAVRTADGALRYVRAESITGDALRSVVIVDNQNPDRPQYLTAARGSIVSLANGRDLVLRLTDGYAATPFLDRTGTLQTVRFARSDITLRGLAADVEAGARVSERAERELTIAQLRARAGARFQGELHRRYATAFACLVFALLAPALGIRFAHGGIGAVIALSVAVLFCFRVGIIWGDRLTDAGSIHPVIGSWGTVALLFAIAIPLLRTAGSPRAEPPSAPARLRAGVLPRSLPGLRLLDGYLLAPFLRTFTITVVSAPLLFALADITIRLDGYLNAGMTVPQVLSLYPAQVPVYLVWAFPIAALVATLFTIQPLVRHGELYAMLGAGVPLRRLFRPLILGGAALSLGALALLETAPRLMNGGRAERGAFVYLTDAGDVLSARGLNGTAMAGVVIRSTGDRYLTAQSARWNEQQGWVLRDGASWDLEQQMTPFDTLALTSLTERPRDLVEAHAVEPASMSFRELGRFAQRLERSGSPAAYPRTRQWERATLPLTTLIIILFAAPLATIVGRGAGHLGAALALVGTVLYLALLRTSEGLGLAGLIHPGLAAALPALAFGMVGLVLLRRART